MALEVIGAGFGRTGTMSLKVALETLGFGPCYHMSEVFANPEHVQLWRVAAQGRLVELPLGRRAALGYRPYVLVEAEQVVWVVVVLKRDQPLVLAVPSEEVLDPLLSLVAGEV